MARPSRARVVTYDPGAQPKGEWAKSLDGQQPFVGDWARIRQQNTERDDRNLVELLDGIQKLERLAEIDKPSWDPPEHDDKTTDIDIARYLLCDTLDHGEPNEWDEARVWREMYEREYAISDKLRQIAQKLDDKLDEEIKGLEEHNEEIDHLGALARRLQLDVGL